MFSFALIVIALLSIALFVLGSAVYVRNAHSLLNKTFFSFTIGVALWVVINYISASTKVPHDVSLWANRIVLIVGGATLLSLLLFVLELTSWLSKTIWLKPLIVLSVLAWLLCLSPLIIKDVFIKDGQVVNDFGNYAPIYFITLFITAILIGATLLRAHFKLEGLIKKQVDTISRSFLVAIPIIVAGNAILPIFGYYQFVSFTPLALSLIIAAMSYVIAKHRLFDIRLVIARTLAYGLSVSFVVLLYAATSFFLASAVFNVNISYQQEIFFAVFSAITALVFQPIKRFFDKYTNRIFYRDAYDGQEVINSVNSKIVNTLDLEKLLQDTADTVESMMRLSFADFYLDSKATIEFHLAGTNTKLFANPHWSSFADEFSKANTDSVTITDENISSELKELMQELSVEAALKMSTTTDNVGYFVVGSRKSGNSFNDQDMQLLEIIADEVAIAVQNALRFEEISQFNITLQKKIDDATRELQKSNEKLQKLDEAKDEFISMASHQLRTPLTSVKGYISMMLEGDAGDITDQQKNFLDQAFLSSQRMVYLIADLLNVSRLKTGKFIIEPKPTYLPDVVESEIAQLHETAKARDLKLIFDKPDSFPTLNLDETKIRQVIMNFADNAIYYTPKGGKITINLKETDESIEYTVRDTGIGVPKSEQHHLFTKFYRAGNAKKARPDGTGLGLFMAKKVVVAQGGAIIFKTEEGKGSTFGFSFPRNKLEVEQQ